MSSLRQLPGDFIPAPDDVLADGMGRQWVPARPMNAIDAALAAEYWRGVEAGIDGCKDEHRATVERMLPWLQHEPDCANRTPEGDCVCGLATALDAAAER